MPAAMRKKMSGDGRGSEESGTSKGTEFKFKGGAAAAAKPALKSATWHKLGDRDSSGGTLPLFPLRAETDERCKSMVLPPTGSFKSSSKGGSSKDEGSSKASSKDGGSEGGKSPGPSKARRSKSVSVADFVSSSRARRVLPQSQQMLERSMSFDLGAHAAAAAREREANAGIFSQIANSIRRVSIIFAVVLGGNVTRSVTPVGWEEERGGRKRGRDVGFASGSGGGEGGEQGGGRAVGERKGGGSGATSSGGGSSGSGSAAKAAAAQGKD